MPTIKETKKNLHIAIVLDKSSSMDNIRNATIKAFNKQVETIHKEGNEGIDIRTSFMTFSTNVNYPIFFNSPINELKKIKKEHYAPAGLTALNDAIGTIIIELLGLPNEEDTDFLVVIVTDGDENASKIFKKCVIKKMKDKLCDKERWTFSFLAANNSIEYFVENYGAEKENVKIFEATEEGMEVAGEYLSDSLSTFISSK